jgi:hypothetical protein
LNVKTRATRGFHSGFGEQGFDCGIVGCFIRGIVGRVNFRQRFEVWLFRMHPTSLPQSGPIGECMAGFPLAPLPDVFVGWPLPANTLRRKARSSMTPGMKLSG